MRALENEHQDSQARKYAYDFDNVLRRYMLRTFLPLMPPGRTLELGSYLGEFTELLAPHCPNLTVVEGAADLAAAVKTRLGAKVEVVQSTFEAFEPQGKFDTIYLMHTLEHIDDSVALLARVRGWLSEKGLLFLVVPNGNAPSRQIAVKMGLISHNTAVTPAEFDHGHRRTYVFDTLEQEARAAQLRVVQRGGVFFKPLANFQFDRLMGTDVMSEGYLEGCYALGMQYPDLCASIYLVCDRGNG